MKTIKIIDLFVKIANGEEVPKKIKYKGVIREYDTTSKDYITRETGEEFYLFYTVLRSGTGDEFVKELNCIVEIIEEDKEMEKGIKPFEEYWEEIEAVGCDTVEAKNVYLDRLSKLVIELREAVNELKKGE